MGRVASLVTFRQFNTSKLRFDVINPISFLDPESLVGTTRKGVSFVLSKFLFFFSFSFFSFPSPFMAASIMPQTGLEKILNGDIRQRGE